VRRLEIEAAEEFHHAPATLSAAGEPRLMCADSVKLTDSITILLGDLGNLGEKSLKARQR
jgi:hypothetical protein